MTQGENAPEELYRLLPSVDELLRRPEFMSLGKRYSRLSLAKAVREELACARADVVRGLQTRETLVGYIDKLGNAIKKRMAAATKPTLMHVLNATGVILHTNLGRAPLSEPALRAIVDVAGGYSNLEFDLETGSRGSRGRNAGPMLLQALASIMDEPLEKLGSEWSVAVVNNCAAATFLAINSLAEGGEVLVSRGELVEIGGGFRVPDILRKAGVTLREVGTTNRTRVSDYAEAITGNTRMILRVHQSNFRMDGFTERPALAALVELGRRANLVVFEDQGTGLLIPLERMGIAGESSLTESLRQAPDLIASSGDKLLGGPQCGLLLGRSDLVDRIQQNPLFRALRVDKLTYAALEATLLSYALHQEHEIPTIRMLRIPKEQLRQRCETIRQQIAADTLDVAVVAVQSVIGGGTTPGALLESFALSLRPRAGSPSGLLAALRQQTLPVVGRVHADCVLLDLRTVPPEDDEVLSSAIRAAVEDWG